MRHYTIEEMDEMLNTSKIVAVIPVLDYKRAKHFYEGVLGFTVNDMEGMGGYGSIEAAGGTLAMLYERGPSHAEHTIATFLVDDLGGTVATLRSHGVVFEDYDLPGLKTVDGIAEAGTSKAAWFKDTEGNVLSITEMTAAAARKAA